VPGITGSSTVFPVELSVKVTVLVGLAITIFLTCPGR
jgi:hypothetical protein